MNLLKTIVTILKSIINLSKTIDLWILARVQRFADWIYDLINLKSLTIAIALLTISVVFLIWTHRLFIDFLGYISILIPLLIWFRFWRMYITLEDISTNSGIDIYARLRLIFLIIAIWSILLLGLKPIQLIGAEVSLLGSLYFASCKKPPKKKSKAREALEKAKEWINGIIAPAPPLPA